MQGRAWQSSHVARLREKLWFELGLNVRNSLMELERWKEQEQIRQAHGMLHTESSHTMMRQKMSSANLAEQACI